MNAIPKSNRFSILTILLAITIFSTILVLIIAIKYSYNAMFIVGSVGGFLILLATSGFLWVYAKRASQMVSPSIIKDAITLGIILGILWMIEISINNFLAPPLPARDILDNIFWAMIAVSIFIYAIVCAYHKGGIRTGITVGTWSGSVSGLLACCMALSVIVFAMHFITKDPLNIAEWAARGTVIQAPTMAAYFAFETLAGAFLHLIVLGVFMGLLLGWLGGAVGVAIKASYRWLKQPG